MSKPRINAKVAKLEIGKPYQWSATGIGVVALDNAFAAGHLIIVEMGDENEYWVMRPTHADLQNMIQTVNRFGKTVYSFPTVVEETPSTESEPEMTTTTAQTAAEITAEQIAQQIADSHHIARRLGFDWKSILAEATKLYVATKPATPTAAKPAKAAKASKPDASDKQVWTLRVVLPSGQVVEAQKSKPYSFASLIDRGNGWEVWAWVSSKETAAKRIGDAKRSGQPVSASKVVEVQLAAQPAPSFDTDRAIMAERAEADQLPEHDMDGSPFSVEPTEDEIEAYEEYRRSGQEERDFAELIVGERTDDDEPEGDDEQPAALWPPLEEMSGLPFEPTAADIEREPVIEDADQPMRVKIKGGSAVHYSDDGEASYCGIARDDMRQVFDAATCRSCTKVAEARAAKV